MKIIYILLLFIILLITIYYIFSETDIKPIKEFKPILSKINYNLYPSGFMVEIISSDPKIYYLHNFINKDEAEYMIKLTDKYIETSKLEIKKLSHNLDNKIRNSSSAYLKKGMTPEIKKIEERAADFANVSYERIESLQTVLYNNNEYYKEHLDSFPADSTYVKKGENRQATIFVYLTTLAPEEGGCTIFNKLNISIKPVKYNAIYFENIKNSIIDERLLHQGEKVIGLNKKYGINIWIREPNF
jgi:prolyl 4-hydroxylase